MAFYSFIRTFAAKMKRFLKTTKILVALCARLLDMPLDKMAADIQEKGKPVAGANGNFRLELCLSDDHQFCALQLFRFGDFKYNAVFEPRFYEGKDVENIALLL